MRPMSIRLRLTCWYGAVLLAGLSLFGFGMWFGLQQRLVSGVDTRLIQRLKGLLVMLTTEDEPADAEHLHRELAEFVSQTQDHMLIELRDSSGGAIVLASSLSQLPFRDLPGYRTVIRNGRAYRVSQQHSKVNGLEFDTLAAVPLDEVDAILGDFQRLLFLAPALMLVACAGGFLLSGIALRPVDEITAGAKSISVQNLSLRIKVPRTGDELQRMAETWNTVLEQLEAAVNRFRQFTADASHELRSPLALIKATAELALRRHRTPEEYRNALRSIDREADRMGSLAESLLTLARADSNRMDLPLAPTDLNRLVTSVAEQQEALAAKRHIRLSVIANGQAPVVSANRLAIERLVLILLDNALRYAGKGGAVTVTARKLADGGLILIEDNGLGIAAEDLPHVFERFYRSDPVRGEIPASAWAFRSHKPSQRRTGRRLKWKATPAKARVSGWH